LSFLRLSEATTAILLRGLSGSVDACRRALAGATWFLQQPVFPRDYPPFKS
jgi:hypothetical protein